LLLILLASTTRAQSAQTLAPGKPGLDAHWTSADKNGIGTSATLESKVWFTLRDGMMTEVYYPTLDVPNVQMLQLVIIEGDRKRVETEEDDTIHRLEILDQRALSFRQVNTARSGAYTITKTYTVDPRRSTILIDIRFRSRKGRFFSVYIYYDPSLDNSGMHDSAWTAGDSHESWLLASDGDKASALLSSPASGDTTNGYLGTSDGLTEMRNRGISFQRYGRAEQGNVVQVAQIEPNLPLTLALGFGRDTHEALENARASLDKGFRRARLEYEAGWHKYVSRLRRVSAQYQRQFRMAAMVLKAHEDKTYRGATVASLSIPWGGGPNANEPNVSGYHAVWPRDLYQIATALLAMGDREGASRALDYLFRVQQKPDGSFPQNSRVEGRELGGALQMDQVALPLVLAYQLKRMDRESWTRHIKPAADFILAHGPRTQQERWEEEAGYSPSTIAAEIAGLVCAAETARRNKDEESASRYLERADDWARQIEPWTATKRGPYGDGNYFLRVTENDNPEDGAQLEINSGGGRFDERSIVDAGFLELVRLGIRRADDPLIAKSLSVVDELIKVETPKGEAWYRYNHDAYGERADGGPYDGRSGRGRLWTLLTGERGEYELARGERRLARARLKAMMAFANDGLMIPEQVWDGKRAVRASLRSGEGTGSATPLAWSMAQFIRLLVNLEEGRNMETPPVVAERYLK
jgi:glucoamylase